ncbi:MAG: tetratricopeptide repeat protein [Cyclobacteriaceae bacterium]|nr:tetratricopeptide repeat protein [Cyclobacteriaceae bacterium]
MIKKLFIALYLILFAVDIFSQSAGIRDLEKKLVQAEDTARAVLLVKLADEYASHNLDHADSLAREALILSEELGHVIGRISSLNSLSYIKSSKGMYEQGFKLCQQALQLSRESGNKEWIGQSLHYLFMVHFKKGEYDQAIPAAQNSLEIGMELNSIRLLAQANDDIGIIKGIYGHHAEAIGYFMESLQLYEQLGDESKTAIALMHLGHTFELAGNYPKALEYLERSLVINQRIGNKFNEAWALVNIGVTYSRLNKVDTALSYYEQSLEISEDINDHRLILTNLDNIGGKYSLMNDFEIANKYLQKAYNLSEKTGVNSRTVYITGNLAENYLYMGQFDSARYFGEKQLELALKSGLISEQKVANYVLAQIYDSLNNHRQAYEALQRYITVNDSIFSREKSQQIEELRENFESEQKERAIASLEKEKKAEQFRRNTFAVLAALILLIGGLLYNNQRIKAKKNKELLQKEQDVEKTKSRFFANITHEFRTPLTLILGPIEMMKSEAVNPKIHQHLDVMKRNASRLLDLVNQLLELSKLESGSLRLRGSTGNIVPVVKGIFMSFESIAQKKGIKLRVKSTKDEINLFFDREKLEKVLINLISNAIRFTPEDGQIQIELNDAEHFLNMVIRDNGTGIPAKDLEFIFDRFYQSENVDGTSGTGIGLALVKELIELHNGSISVKSEEGAGTEFFIRLPMKDIPESAEELIIGEKIRNEIVTSPPEQNDLNNHDSIPDWDMQKISQKPILLLIEDNTDVRNYIFEILKGGYTVLQAGDGEEGISMAIGTIPDLIISDVMMPKRDGNTVCSTLKNNEKTSHIPIILLTAKVTTEDKILGLENQADDYVTKPFVPKELLVRVQNLIESRKKLRERFQRELVLKPSEVAVNSVEEQFVNKLLKIVDEHIGDEKFGVEKLALEIGMSRSQIHRKLLALTNQAPNQFIRTFRLTRAMELVKKRSATTSEIAYKVGFSSPSYFTKCFRDHYGRTPSEIPESSPEASGK